MKCDRKKNDFLVLDAKILIPVTEDIHLTQMNTATIHQGISAVLDNSISFYCLPSNLDRL
jgi:hypothetical protein